MHHLRWLQAHLPPARAKGKPTGSSTNSKGVKGGKDDGEKKWSTITLAVVATLLMSTCVYCIMQKYQASKVECRQVDAGEASTATVVNVGLRPTQWQVVEGAPVALGHDCSVSERGNATVRNSCLPSGTSAPDAPVGRNIRKRHCTVLRVSLSTSPSETCEAQYIVLGC